LLLLHSSLLTVSKIDDRQGIKEVKYGLGQHGSLALSSLQCHWNWRLEHCGYHTTQIQAPIKSKSPADLLLGPAGTAGLASAGGQELAMVLGEPRIAGHRRVSSIFRANINSSASVPCSIDQYQARFPGLYAIYTETPERRRVNGWLAITILI